jgi:CRP-like cAMP-binding protein
MQPSTDLLAQNRLFASMNAKDRTVLMQHAIPREYEKGATIAALGDVWQFLFLVQAGMINAIKESSEGRSLIVASMGAGEIFWGMAFFYDDAPNIVTLQAREKTRLLVWPRDTLLPILLANGKAAWELCRLMIRRMEHASEILHDLAFQPVAGRVARVLIDHHAGADEDRLARDLTLDEMAARAGTTREVVCRTLYRLSDKGLIRITRTEFQLIDKTGLAQMAERF